MKIYRLAQLNQEYPIEIGNTYFFEYHCNESHDSADAQLWYRSQQPVKVLALIEPGLGKDFIERGENGHSAVYKVEFNDGSTGDVFEDELLDSEGDYCRPAPPKGVL